VGFIDLGSVNIFSLYELNGKIAVGFSDGSVRIVKVSYPNDEDSDSKIRTIIIIGVVVFVFVAVVSIVLAIYCCRKSSQV
jgi:hypothetical protein